MMLWATPGTIAQPVAEHCTVRYRDEMENVTPTGTTFIAVSEFPLSCRGGIHGSLTVMGGRIADTQLQIEKMVGDHWTVVGQGNTLAYRAEPGIYRLTVTQTSEKGSFTRWKLRYSKPLP